MSEVSFIVNAKPQPQGSIKSFRHKTTGAIVSMSTNPELHPFRTEVAWQAKRALYYANLHAPMIGKHQPVEVEVEFMFLPPRNNKKRVWPVVKPDIDKLERALLDSLTGICYVDDAQVVRVKKEKVYGCQERVKVSVRLVTDGMLF